MATYNETDDRARDDIILVSYEVFKVLKEDGFYGEYVLGEDLWNKFQKAFKNVNT